MTKGFNKFFNRSLANQSGGMMPFFAILLVGIVGVTALTIDQGRGFLVHRNVEDLADAVALAASASLDGTQLGWQNAKRLALITVNESRVYGIDRDATSDADSFGAGTDPWEDEANFRSNRLTLDDGRLIVTIERGFFAYTSSDEVPEFTSLEGANPQHFYLPKFFIANAVRASVEVRDVATPIGNVVAQLATGTNFESFSSIYGESIAVRHNELEYPVAPIAIPACELLGNMDVTSANRYHTQGFLPTSGDSMTVVYGRSMLNQCQREVVAREPGAIEGDYAGNERRIDGNLRSESFPRPPLTEFEAGDSGLCYANDVEGLHINCKIQPLNASLGRAGLGGDSSYQIGAGALAAALNAARGTGEAHSAKLGAAFNPMGGSSYLDNAGVRDATLSLINDGTPFRNVFYDGDRPAFNFPYRRNLVSTAEAGYTDPFAEMRITWMTREGADSREVAMLMGNAGDFHTDTDLTKATPGDHLRYTNPLCHNNNIPFDDKDRARAKTVNIMLVASADEPFCDLSSDYGDASPIDAVVPQSTTNPIIVGYAQAHIFDFRFSQYTEQDWWLGGPDDPDLDDVGTDLPAADAEGNVLTDDNQFAFDSQFELPGLQDYLQDAETFAENQRDFLRCQSCLNNDWPEPECDDERTAYSDAGDVCPDEPEDLGPPPIPTWMEDCFGDSAAVIDLLSLLDDLEPHAPPVADDSDGGDGPPEDFDLPPCKEYCGGVRKYRTSSLYFDRTGPDAYDEDCFTEMVAGAGGSVCAEDDNFWTVEGEMIGCEGPCPDSGCCVPNPRPPIPGDECSVLCEAAPAGFRARCEALCNEFRDRDNDTTELIEYLRVLEEIYSEFQEMLDDRYGTDEDGDGDRDGSAPFETTGPPGSGANGAGTAPDLNLAEYIDTNDGADQVCLPRRLNDCFDMTNPSCWEDPVPRQSGWGCGGIRMRLSCSTNALLAPLPHQELRPALVSK